MTRAFAGSCVAALLVLLKTSSGFAVDLPRHRGPLTPSELRTIVVRERQTKVRAYRAAAQRFLDARKAGRPWKSSRYDMIADGDQGTYLVPKGELGMATHALITEEGKVHVRVNLLRHESGKPSPTLLRISYNPGQSIDAPLGPGTMLIYEDRTSVAANETTPGARGMFRSYYGPDWQSTRTHENDGWGQRNGQWIGLSSPAVEYQPGGRMGIRNGQTLRFTTARGKRALE